MPKGALHSVIFSAKLFTNDYKTKIYFGHEFSIRDF